MKRIFILTLLGVFLGLTGLQAQPPPRTINVTPGNLSSLLGADKTKVTDLILTGLINDTDFLTLKEMTALKNLDMGGVNVSNNTIPQAAFYGRAMNKIVLPSSIETIGVGAFQHTALIQPLVIPLGLKKIEAFAFSYTKMVSALDLSRHNSLTIIGNRAFEATNLHVILPLNMTYLPDGSFNAFGGTVDLPPNLETIGVAAFQHANLPKPLVIPLGLKKIEAFAFSYTKMVSALDLSRHNSLTIIGNRAFEATNLHVILPLNMTYVLMHLEELLIYLLIWKP